MGSQPFEHCQQDIPCYRDDQSNFEKPDVIELRAVITNPTHGLVSLYEKPFKGAQ